jgi:hypothetical protein
MMVGSFSDNVGSWLNGMKLASKLLLDQLLTQCLPGFDHQREALGPPLLDARLHAMRSDGVDEQRASWEPGARRAQPAERIQKTAPLHAHVLEYGGVPHDHADSVVDDGKGGQFLQDT